MLADWKSNKANEIWAIINMLIRYLGMMERAILTTAHGK